MSSRKPYIAVADRSPFGEDIDESMLDDPARDSTYIEGYSDVRRDRELALRRGERPRPLKHRLHIARAKSIDGTRTDGRRLDHWQSRRGYRPIQWDEAVKLGYRVDENPAFSKAEDGTVRHGNGMLMIADAKVAAANLKRVTDDTQAQNEMAAQRVQQSVERFNRSTKGATAEAFSFLGDEEPTE